MARIELRSLRKEYVRGVAAVADLDLHIADGEFLTLLGPSGCGKSTTLRMIAGLETPTAGDVLFDGRRVNDDTPAQRNVAMVFQNYALYPHMTVRENLEYPLRKRKVARPEIARRAEQVAQLLQIGALMDRRPRQLSGGQQQRVALGRALIREPQAFLLDEPLSNLDAKLRAHMRAELVELHRRVEATMVYVTHDQLEAMTMSDRIAIFDHGRVQQVGTPDDVYNRPANLTVAAFIGTPTMNVVAGELVDEGGIAVFRSGVFTLPLAIATARARPRAVTLGVRPENVRLGVPGADGRVAVVEPSGHETIVTLSVGPERLVARVAPDTALTVGETVRVGADPARIHLFDTVTGRRLDGTSPGAPERPHGHP